jgi:hypothetical protein
MSGSLRRSAKPCPWHVISPLTARLGLVNRGPLQVRDALQQTVRRDDGRIAQLVERGIENPCVGGSSPSLATPFWKTLLSDDRG